MGLLDLFGGSSQPTTTTTLQLSPQQQKILNWAMPGIKSYATSPPPEYYPGQTVAPFTSAQTTGQNMALGAASGPLQGLANNATSANNFLLGDIWNPSSNPYLQSAIDAAVRPVTENYQQVVRPAVRDYFTGAGQQFGGSRRNIAEGIAARDYGRNVSDTASKLVQNQYGTNINAMLQALGLAPTTQGTALAPAVATSGVGDVQQQQRQQQINADIQRYNYNQLAPFLQSQDILSLLQGIPGGSVTSTANLPSSNPLTSGLGGALTGAKLGSLVPGIGTALGAGIGGLIGLL